LKVYLAGPIFTYGDLLRNTEWAKKIRDAIPNIDLYSPVENTDINGVEGKKKFAGSQEIANGDNLGVALSNTGRDFPNQEIIGDLTIYSEMNDFDANIERLADDYLQNSVRKMESISSTLNSFGILLVSAIIAWVVLATFQMQDQITMMLS
jgi:type II secretory pathway component PulF